MLRRFRENDGYEQWCRRAEWPMVGLAVAFLVVLLLPLSVSLTAEESSVLRSLDIAIWAAFAAEYAIRLYLVPDRINWIRTHLLDLVVVIVPFLRPLRLIRVIALLLSTGRRASALVISQVLLAVAGLALIIMCVGAVVVYHYERTARGSGIHSLGGAFWWAFTTVSTVGANTEAPVTTIGRVVAGVLVFTGLGVVGCITAAVAAAFVNAVRGRPMHEQITEAHDHQRELGAKVDLLTEAVAKLHVEVRAVRELFGTVSPMGDDSQLTVEVEDVG